MESKDRFSKVVALLNLAVGGPEGGQDFIA